MSKRTRKIQGGRRKEQNKNVKNHFALLSKYVVYVYTRYIACIEERKRDSGIIVVTS